ncbi:MAG: GAF domain-containing protein, partial [Elusimicrobia bacterium]|nr:GAF domain-containing protein [Elusimicrobiota bacterium]
MSGSPPDAERTAWLDGLRALLGASAAWLIRRDDGGAVVEASAGPAALPAGTRRPLADLFDRAVLESGRPALVRNAATDPAFAATPLFRDRGCQSYAGVPRAGGRDGALAALSERPGTFSEGDLAFLARLARCAPGEDPSAFDAAIGAIAAEPFADLAGAALARGSAGLAAFRPARLDEVLRDKGPETAGRLLAQLASVLREAAPAPGLVGRLGADAVGVLLPGEPLRGAQR